MKLWTPAYLSDRSFICWLYPQTGRKMAVPVLLAFLYLQSTLLEQNLRHVQTDSCTNDPHLVHRMHSCSLWPDKLQMCTLASKPLSLIFLRCLSNTSHPAHNCRGHTSSSSHDCSEFLFMRYEVGTWLPTTLPQKNGSTHSTSFCK